MLSPKGRTRSVWLLPIIVLACAIMVAPAGVLLGHDALSSAAHAQAARTQPSVARARGGGADTLGLSPYAFSHSTLPSSADVASSGIPTDKLSEKARPWLGDSPTIGGPSALTAPESHYGPLVSPPNLALAKDTSATPTEVIAPGYQAPPAPLGLADYGVGVNGTGAMTPYAYSTSDFLGEVTFQAPPNVTDPGSAGVMDPSGSNFGLVGSPYEFSLQLNTIGDNLTELNTSDGWIWAQNVIDMNNSAIHFVDDLWNLTADSDFAFSTNAIASACGLTNVSALLAFEGGVVQCVGGSVPINPSDFPLTIQLYNNLTVNGAHQDVVVFGERIVGDGALLSAGTIASVTFVNPTGAAPVFPPTYVVNGYSRSPIQPAGLPELLQDAEITFGGPIGGTNAVFHTLNGSVSLLYGNGAGWSSIPSAFNFGSDTGETSIGIASYWDTAGTEEVNQGPAFLYGLWNTPANLSVAAGSITFQGTADPNYGFVFLSNVAPDANATNQSYVPTAWNGRFNTTLPPAIPSTNPYGYYPTLYAAGFYSVNGTPFTGSTFGYSFGAVTPSPEINAPLYLNGTAQANALAYNLTGRPITSTGPYFFVNMVVNLPLAFTHLNDYAFPSFVIVASENLPYSLYLNNVYEGQNAPGGELYTLDYSNGAAGWMYPSPAVVGPLYNFTEEFDLWDSYHPNVQNETLFGAAAYGSPGGGGGAVFLFQDYASDVANITSVGGSEGVADVNSFATLADNLTAIAGGNGLDVIASFGTVAANVTADGYFLSPEDASVGIYALGSVDGYYLNVDAYDDATGYAAGANYGLGPQYSLFGSDGDEVYNILAIGGRGFAVADSAYDSFVNTGAYYGALGGNISASYHNVVTNMSVFEAGGLDLFRATNTTIYGLNETDTSFASEWLFSNNTTLEDSVFNYTAYALGIFASNRTFVEGLWVNDSVDLGVLDEATNDTVFVNVLVSNTTEGAWGIVVYESELTGFVSLLVNSTLPDATGVVVEDSFATDFLLTAVTDVDEYSYGVALYGDVFTNLTSTFIDTVEPVAVGVFAEDDLFTNLTETEATFIYPESAGVALEDTYATTIDEALVAYIAPDAYGLALIGGEGAWVNYTTYLDLLPYAAGVLIGDQAYTWFNSTVVYGEAPLSVGIDIVESEDTYLNDTLAENGDGWGIAVNYSATTYLNNTSVYSEYGGVLVNASTATSFSTTWLNDTEFGVKVGNSSATAFDTTYVGDGSEFGVQVNASSDTTLTATIVNDSFDGVFVNNSPATSIDGLSVFNAEFGAWIENTSGATVQDVIVADAYVGVYLWESPSATVTGVEAYAAIGTLADRSNDLTASQLYAVDAAGVILDNSSGAYVSDASTSYGGVAVYVSSSNDSTVTNVSATYGSYGVELAASSHDTVSDVTATDASGVIAFGSSDLTVTQVAARNGSEGVVFFRGDDNTASDLSATNGSFAAGAAYSTDASFADVTATDGSVGVLLLGSNDSVVTDVTATNATLGPAWNTRALPLAVPISAVAIEGANDSTVEGVTTYQYPVAIYANDTLDLIVANVNASYGDIGILLNGTSYSLFTNITAYHDDVGFESGLADGPVFYSVGDVVTASRFVDDTSYGVELLDGTYADYVYYNTFVGDNGASTTYSVLHIQAYSALPYNWFNSTSKIGNYWADWHTYSNGVLAPYFVGTGAWDYYPLGAPEGEYVVSFHESGLPVGTSWSVTLNGTTETSTTSTISFAEYPGTYAFTVGSLAGWSISPASGAVTVTNNAVVVNVTTSTIDTVTFSESGLPVGTSWSVVLNGIEHTSTGTTVTFTTVGGSYAYTVVAPAGYTATPPNGTLAIGGGYLQPVSFRLTSPPPQKVLVNVQETGLPTGTSWTAYVGGSPVSGSTATLTIEVAANSTYDYQATATVPLSIYSAAPGKFSVQASTYDLVVAFHPVLYTVTFSETGLAGGTSWSVVVNGQTYPSSGTTVTVQLTNGSYTYAFNTVSGYALPATGASGTGTVNGAAGGVATTYTASTSSTAYVPKSTFNTDLGVAIAVAAVAIVLAVLALLRKPKSPPPAAPWAEPAASTPSPAAPDTGGKPGA